MIDNESLPGQDDVQNQGPSEQELLDAVMQNSPIIDEIDAPPLPEEEDQVPDPVESEDEEDPVEEEAVSEEEELEEEEVEEEVEDGDDTEEVSTEVPDVFTADDLDLDAKLMVKVDGEELEVSFGDLIKGYQTDSHLSKKGREISEAQKAIEEQREEKLKEVADLAQASSAMLYQTEQFYAKQYKDFEDQVAKARADGDTYELGELKDKREQAQANYWNARQRREGIVKQVQEESQKRQEELWQQQIGHFQEEIPNLIPDFNEDIALKIREFAIQEGINPEALDQITDPIVVKFVDDYRRLKQGVKKGAAKRKKLPTKKSIPNKKAASVQQKRAAKEQSVRDRALTEDASRDDQMAFLKQYASKSLSNT